MRYYVDTDNDIDKMLRGQMCSFARLVQNSPVMKFKEFQRSSKNLV